jgi:hypothetical protein
VCHKILQLGYKLFRFAKERESIQVHLGIYLSSSKHDLYLRQLHIHMLNLGSRSMLLRGDCSWLTDNTIYIITLLYRPPTAKPECEGFQWHKIGLSPPACYLYKPWGKAAFKCNLYPRHHVCIKDYHSSLAQGYSSLFGALVLERPIKGDETDIMT